MSAIGPSTSFEERAALVRTWGVEDGSGFPIEMTGSAYVDRFVLDKDYSKASSVETVDGHFYLVGIVHDQWTI